MNTKLAFLALAIFAASAFASDEPHADVPAAAAKAAPEADAGKPDAVAKSEKKGCAMLVGTSSKDLTAGAQVCWRHPEYLTCTNSGDWVPKFCEQGTHCVESGGKTSCVQNEHHNEPSVPNEVEVSDAAQADKAAPAAPAAAAEHEKHES